MEDKDTRGRFSRNFNLAARCRSYGLPVWQCPEFLFVLMGTVTIGAVLGIYFALEKDFDPYFVAMAAMGVAFFLLLQTSIIVRVFERLAEANRRQIEFLNIASHQLRGPVTAARWAIDILDQAPEGFSVEAQQSFSIIRDSVHRLAQLITSILGVSRIEAGTSQKRAESFALNLVIVEVTDAAKRYAQAENLKVNVHLPQHMLYVYADREQIYYVVDHLLDNALRFSSSPSTISVSLEQDGNEAKITVSDHGAGVPSEEQKHIFEKFFRASNAAVLAPGGAGLSLFVTRAVVESFGGRIGFTSTPEKGSTFWFTLPLHDPRKV